MKIEYYILDPEHLKRLQAEQEREDRTSREIDELKREGDWEKVARWENSLRRAPGLVNRFFENAQVLHQTHLEAREFTVIRYAQGLGYLRSLSRNVHFLEPLLAHCHPVCSRWLRGFLLQLQQEGGCSRASAGSSTTAPATVTCTSGCSSSTRAASPASVRRSPASPL